MGFCFLTVLKCARVTARPVQKLEDAGCKAYVGEESQRLVTQIG